MAPDLRVFAPRGRSASSAALRDVSPDRCARRRQRASTARVCRTVDAEYPARARPASSRSTSAGTIRASVMPPMPATPLPPSQIRAPAPRYTSRLRSLRTASGGRVSQSPTTWRTVMSRRPTVPAFRYSSRSAASFSRHSVLVGALTLRRLRLRVSGSRPTSSEPTQQPRDAS
jgi:hypothetical protein